MIENLIGLCGDGTRGCHGTLETRAPGWRVIAQNVRAAMTPAQVAYVVGRKSLTFLDRYYTEGA